MTVEQLIVLLKNYPQKAEVRLMADDFYSKIQGTLLHEGIVYISNDAEDGSA